jgi:hypothetical protein
VAFVNLQSLDQHILQFIQHLEQYQYISSQKKGSADLFVLCVLLNSDAGREMNKRIIYARDNGSDGRRALPGSRSSVGDVDAHHHCRFGSQPFHRRIIELTNV